jgi:hypothetical protein
MGSVMLRVRLIADFFLVVAFGFVAPMLLAPIGRSAGVMLVSAATFGISLGFLWDGLRAAGHLHR